MMATEDIEGNRGCPCRRKCCRGYRRKRASWVRGQNPFEQSVKVAG